MRLRLLDNEHVLATHNDIDLIASLQSQCFPGFSRDHNLMF